MSGERTEEWKAARRGICWMCGCKVEHKAAHDCPMDDGS